MLEYAMLIGPTFARIRSRTTKPECRIVSEVDRIGKPALTQRVLAHRRTPESPLNLTPTLMAEDGTTANFTIWESGYEAKQLLVSWLPSLLAVIGVAQKRIQHHSGNTLEIINAEAGDLFSLLGSAWNRELLYRNARKRTIRVSTHKDLITALFFLPMRLKLMRITPTIK